MKVALVHDDLVQWGGAERVLVALSEMYPDAPIYTSLFDKEHPLLKEKFHDKKIITSFIQKIPGWKYLYKPFLPLYPLAFEQFDFSEYDLVVSNTTRFAKSIITKPGTVHICYCHTPPRFLWGFSGQKVTGILKPYLNWLRRYDKESSTRPDFFIAGSKNAQQRIQDIYGRDSKVVYPFVELERFSSVKPFQGNYLLVIARLIPYKKVDLVIKAAKRLKLPLKIVGDGPQAEKLKALAGPQVDFFPRLDEETLMYLLAGCKALVVAAEEDFGMGPLEAQVLGKPIIAFKKGGALETVIEGKTGYFFEEQNVDSLIEALKKLDELGYNEESCFAQAQAFSKTKFVQQFQDICTNSLKESSI